MIVVAGVDNSPTSKHVLARAVEQAKTKETDVHVVHVAYSPTVHADVPIDWGEVVEAQRAQVWSQLEDVISDADVPVERVDLDGYPPDKLIAYANDRNASMVVVGTRGHGEVASLILGSTSHRVIHLANCDVLVVKPQGE